MVYLGLLREGEKAEIVQIKAPHGDRKDQFCHAGDMGLRVGKVIEILNSEGSGPILLKVGESRIAIGRGMAMKIIVRRID